MTAPVLEVRDLVTEFHTRRGVARAVDGVSLSLNRGEILGLVGESGSGKSVTGFSLLGLVDEPGRIAAGSVRLEGRELVGLPSGAMRALAFPSEFLLSRRVRAGAALRAVSYVAGFAVDLPGFTGTPGFIVPCWLFAITLIDLPGLAPSGLAALFLRHLFNPLTSCPDAGALIINVRAGRRLLCTRLGTQLLPSS